MDLAHGTIAGGNGGGADVGGGGFRYRLSMPMQDPFATPPSPSGGEPTQPTGSAAAWGDPVVVARSASPVLHPVTTRVVVDQANTTVSGAAVPSCLFAVLCLEPLKSNWQCCRQQHIYLLWALPAARQRRHAVLS